MMRRAALAALLLATASLAPAHAAYKTPLTSCKPLGMAKSEFQALKASGWTFADRTRRDDFLLALADCTGATDPEYRDLLAFEAMQSLVRKGDVDAATLSRLADILEKQLAEPDPSGVRRPFAALNLAEIARADRVAAFMPHERRKAMLAASTGYMRAITDYRGFDPKVGYRHAVAHAADLLMQWSLNPALDKDDLIQIRDAVGVQVAPLTTAYVTGESERLARPIFFVAQRGLLSAEDWNLWFAGLSEPGALQSWGNYHLNPAAIARRHNAQAFLMAVYVSADASENEAYKPLVAASLEALKKLP
jgi:Protein of unknown function (DUF2785)